MKIVWIPGWMGLVLALAACGESPDESAPEDGGPQPMVDMEVADVGVSDVGVPSDCDHQGFDLATGTITETMPGRLGFRATSGRDRFEIDLVFGGVQEGADGVGSWDLSGQRRRYLGGVA